MKLGGLKILMRTVALDEEDQKIVEQLADYFGVSEYDIIHESLLIYYRFSKMSLPDRFKVTKLLAINEDVESVRTLIREIY